MAGGRRRNKVSISLFPFLSILACVIGTLTLMIAALALGQMDTDAVASAEKYEQVKRQLEADRKAVEELQREFADRKDAASDVAERLIEAREELARLEREKERLQKELELPVDVKVPIPTIDEAKQKQRLEELQAELAEQEERKQKLLAELAERKKPPEEAEVIVRPSGSGSDLEPTFVECRSNGVVIHEGDNPPFVRREDLNKNETFLALLDRIAQEPKATVIFLIRDDGLGTYFAARNLARAHYARNGKLPIIGHGKLDLSLFKNE